MFSTISSYIWGAEANVEANEASSTPEVTATASVKPSTPTPASKVAGRRRKSASKPSNPTPGDDWVMIGNEPNPGNLQLGDLEPLPAMSSATSSVNGEQAGTVEDAEMTTQSEVPAPTPRHHHHSPESLGLQQTQKCLRQAQFAKQRNTSKALSSKALKRGNKAVTGGCGSGQARKQAIIKHNLPIKAAGFNKNLKQC